MTQKNGQKKRAQANRLNLLEEARKAAEKKSFQRLSNLISDFKERVDDRSREAIGFIIESYDGQIERGRLFAVVIKEPLSDEHGRNEEIVAETPTLLSWINEIQLQYMIIKMKKEDVCFNEDFATRNFMEIAQVRRKPKSKLLKSSKSSMSRDIDEQTHPQISLGDERDGI